MISFIVHLLLVIALLLALCYPKKGWQILIASIVVMCFATFILLKFNESTFGNLVSAAILVITPVFCMICVLGAEEREK